MHSYLVYIGFAFPHHVGTHAGYNHIKDFVKYDKVIDTHQYIKLMSKDSLCFWEKLIAKFLKFSYLLECSLLALYKGHAIFHFVYGENNFEPFPLMHLRGSKVVVTFHQPYDWFVENADWLKKIRKIDEITLVGKSELQLFEKATGKKNVHFFPHGICTNFYCPTDEISKENMILMVGNWLRDFSFASNIFRIWYQYSPKTRVVVVTNKSNSHFFRDNANVEIMSGISDERLRDLYRKTQCLFLPLERYTANNALLEASAVGCNILIASNHADNSYIPEEYINICPMDKNKVIEKLKKVMNLGVNHKLSEFVRNKYSWEIVGKQLMCFFNKMNNN